MAEKDTSDRHKNAKPKGHKSENPMEKEHQRSDGKGGKGVTAGECARGLLFCLLLAVKIKKLGGARRLHKIAHKGNEKKGDGENQGRAHGEPDILCTQAYDQVNEGVCADKHRGKADDAKDFLGRIVFVGFPKDILKGFFFAVP